MKGAAARLGEILGGGRKERKFTAEQQDALALWASSPWAFLAGQWPLPRHAGAKGGAEPEPIFWTLDSYEGKIRPFPADFDYLRYAVIEPAFMGGPGRLPPFLLDKPRQVLATTGVLGGIAWEVLFQEARTWLIAKNKREEAEDLIVEKMRFSYERLPAFLQEYRPVRPKPAGRFRCKATSSVAKAVAKNFGKSEAKGSTADVFIDEAVLLPNLRSAFEAASAMARRIIMVATPPEDGEAEPESVLFYRELLEGRAPGELTQALVGAPSEDDGDEDEVDELVGVVAH